MGSGMTTLCVGLERRSSSSSHDPEPTFSKGVVDMPKVKGSAPQPGGKQGPVSGSMTSSEGGQWSHLPKGNSYPNANMQRPSRSSTSSGPHKGDPTGGPNWSHMPKNPGGKKK